ncbi:methyltransferase domain-containing protein [bacterium]|nr:methyltransferase domain-containing protein [bacterium]
MSQKTSNGITYFLGDSDGERQRLTEQAAILEPFTRRLFESAGIAPGMRVLDVGSGAGDVALLAAEMVGPTGSVTGVDRNADIMEVARSRAKASGYDNITFLNTDVNDLMIDDAFDAVVGRAVLMYQLDPVVTLKQATRSLRDGGIVAFLEFDTTTGGGISIPNSSVVSKCWRWFIETMQLSRVERHMGFKLPSAYKAAGLLHPQMQAHSVIGGGPNWPGYKYVEHTMRSMLPVMEQFGVTTAKEVEVDTLAERLEAESLENGTVFMVSNWIGAWTHKV